MCKPFSRRMWDAVAFIESGREHSRQLDAALENGDGDAMVAALYTLAEKRPTLKRNLPRYILPPGEVNAERVLPLMGKPMAEIRKAGERQRAGLLAWIDKERANGWKSQDAEDVGLFAQEGI